MSGNPHCTDPRDREVQGCWLNYAKSLPSEDAETKALCAGHRSAMAKLSKCLTKTGCLDKETKEGILATCRSPSFLPQCDLGCEILFSGAPPSGVSTMSREGSYRVAATSVAVKGEAVLASALSDLLPPSGGACPAEFAQSCVLAVLQQHPSPTIVAESSCKWASHLSEAIRECSTRCLTGPLQRQEYHEMCMTLVNSQQQQLEAEGCPGVGRSNVCVEIMSAPVQVAASSFSSSSSVSMSHQLFWVRWFAAVSAAVLLLAAT